MTEPLPHIADESPFPRVFRVDAQLRRCCIYLVVGGWVCMGTLVAISLALGQPLDGARLASMVPILGIAPLGLWLYVATYRLRLDESGLWRRRICWWSLWPWELFTSGKVGSRKMLFECRSRPLWDRWLVAEHLASEDKQFLKEVIERLTSDECRQQLKLGSEEITEATLGFLPAGKLKLTRTGCELLEWWPRRFAWEEVSEVRLEASRQGEHDVNHLVLTFFDRTEVRRCINRVMLPGAYVLPFTAGHDEWVAHIESLIPTRCWKYLRMKGPLRSLEEGEFRLRQWKKQALIAGWCEAAGWLFLPASLAIFGPGIIGVWNMPFFALGWKVVTTVCFVLTMIMPSFILILLGRHIRSNAHKQAATVCAEMAALESAPSNEHHAHLSSQAHQSLETLP